MRGLSMIAGVGLLMSLASAQQNDYNQYCNPPSNPPPEVQVEPGLYRKYHCDKSPSSSAYLGLPPVQASPDECTRQCAARVDHAKCSWSEGYCFFYGPSASITGHHGAIYVTYRKDQTAQINQLTQDLDNCRQHNDVIEAAATACLSDLAQCETDRDTCIAARDTCTQDLDDCQAANNGGNGGGTSGDIPECYDGGNSGDTFTAHELDWKLSCNNARFDGFLAPEELAMMCHSPSVSRLALETLLALMQTVLL